VIEALRFENISFAYDDHHTIFDKVSFEFPVNGNFCVKTRGGSGRSTLLKILAGLHPPTGGSYWINDFEVFDQSFSDFLPYRLKMGYGFDMGGLLSNKSLKENLLLPLNYHFPDKPEEDEAIVANLIDVFGLRPEMNERPAHVTGAMRKACCVARAFVMKPEILLLDDPAQGLTEGGIDMLARLIKLHRKRFGLKHVYLATEDKFLPRALNCGTIWVGKTEMEFLPYEEEEAGKA